MQLLVKCRIASPTEENVLGNFDHFVGRLSEAHLILKKLAALYIYAADACCRSYPDIVPCRIDYLMNFESDVFGAIIPVGKKKMKFLTGRDIHCISRSSLGTFILCAGIHWSN